MQRLEVENASRQPLANARCDTGQADQDRQAHDGRGSARDCHDSGSGRRVCKSHGRTQSRQALRIVRINAAEAPVIDGDVSDAAWRRALAQTIVTQHGANFDGGESRVEVRALHDGTFAYFAFTWTDPTRSLKHMPLVKQEDGWRLMRSASVGNEAELHEDKFAVLLAAGGQHLIGKGIHFGGSPFPASLKARQAEACITSQVATAISGNGARPMAGSTAGWTMGISGRRSAAAALPQGGTRAASNWIRFPSVSEQLRTSLRSRNLSLGVAPQLSQEPRHARPASVSWP